MTGCWNLSIFKPVSQKSALSRVDGMEDSSLESLQGFPHFGRSIGDLIFQMNQSLCQVTLGDGCGHCKLKKVSRISQSGGLWNVNSNGPIVLSLSCYQDFLLEEAEGDLATDRGGSSRFLSDSSSATAIKSSSSMTSLFSNISLFVTSTSSLPSQSRNDYFDTIVNDNGEDRRPGLEN